MLLHDPDGCILRSIEELIGSAFVADRTNGNSEFISKADYKRGLKNKEQIETGVKRKVKVQ